MESVSGKRSRALRKMARDHQLNPKLLKRLYGVFPKDLEFVAFEVAVLERVYK
jgi:hypothetical protein